MRIHLAGAVSSALTHLAAVGLANIAVDAGMTTVRTWWEDDKTARAVVSWTESGDAGTIVLAHALRHAASDSWVQATFSHLGRTTGVFSPRIKTPTDPSSWAVLAAERRARLDTGQLTRLDHRFIGALGEPAYWFFDRPKGIADNGASRWEMKTRNRGEEFVQNRLAKLAAALAGRAATEVQDGLTGRSMNDESTKNDPNSRTPSGLQAPGPADTALTWCALWGISSLQTIPRSRSISASSGVSPQNAITHPRVMSLPVFGRPVSVSRWREVAASRQFSDFTFPDGDRAASGSWLRSHHLLGVVDFPTKVGGSTSAPERYLLPGRFREA